MYKNFIKPIGDILIGLILLIILFPIILIIAIILFISNWGKVFFVQQRPGLNGKPFKIIKFKTMRDEYDQNGNPLPDNIRLTKVGNMIRSLSLDELLQLVNVIKGEMSLVGPRPLLMQYLNLYSLEQAKRHNVKPGITGLAQINGRNSISWEKKFKYDVMYVEKQSFILDIKIFCITFINVLKKKGINVDGRVTMEEFSGNN